MGFTEKSNFLRGKGVPDLKVGGGGDSGGGGGGGSWTVFRFKGEGGLVKKERLFSLTHFGRQGACHDISKSADSQTYINFPGNDCIIAEIL